MIRSAFSSIGLVLVALLSPYALIQLFVGDYVTSAFVYITLLAISILFFIVTDLAYS